MSIRFIHQVHTNLQKTGEVAIETAMEMEQSAAIKKVCEVTAMYLAAESEAYDRLIQEMAVLLDLDPDSLVRICDGE